MFDDELAHSSRHLIRMKSFAEALKYALDIKGFNGRDLAEKFYKDEAQISRYLTGKNVPFKKTVRQISKLLGIDIFQVDATWFVTLPKDMPDGPSRVAEPLTPYNAGEEPALPGAEPSVADVVRMLEQIEASLRICRDALSRMKPR